MAKVLNCDCGFVIRGETDDEFVANALAHAREAHNLELTAEQVLAMAETA
jgi:predicted small metal-binding protein